MLFGDLVAALEYATDQESGGASKETSDATIQSPPDSTRACCLSDCPARDVAVVAFWLVCSVLILVVLILVKESLAGFVLISVGTLFLLAYFWAASNLCGTSTPDFKPGTNAQRHRLIHAKHGSKHGSGRLSSIFGTHAQSHRLHRAKYGSKHGSKHGSGSLAALFTSTSGSVRGSVGAPAP